MPKQGSRRERRDPGTVTAEAPTPIGMALAGALFFGAVLGVQPSESWATLYDDWRKGESPSPLQPAAVAPKKPAAAPKPVATKDPTPSIWNLKSSHSNECPAGQRNADERECLKAAREVVVDANALELKTIGEGASGAWSAAIPLGCSYSNKTKHVYFNRRRARSAPQDGHPVAGYQMVCTSNNNMGSRYTARMPVAEPENHDAECTAGSGCSFAAGKAGAAQMAAFVSGWGGSHSRNSLMETIRADGGPYPQFVCDAQTTVLDECPNVVASSHFEDSTNIAFYGGPTPHLTVSAGEQLLFAGPDYLMEIYVAVLAANGGCASVDGQVCVQSNGARIAFIRSLDVDDSIVQTNWTHGFFMEPNARPYNRQGIGPRYWQLRGVLEPRVNDTTGPDMCVPSGFNGASNLMGYAEYVDCVNAKRNLKLFDGLLRGAKRTLAVPWHVAPPPDNVPVLGTYFTRSWAVMMDCRPSLRRRPSHAAVPSPSPSASLSLSNENTEYYRSFAKRNPRHENADASVPYDPIQSQALTDLQCLTICEPAAAGKSCYFGSIVWMAHDLLSVATHRPR